ncbi:MAG: hypothetical protein LBB53_02250 [Prevotellaceae bacterium]|jgi:hypothetical protein|nr:hypothetical protein [Prevotellaceae bacterium]
MKKLILISTMILCNTAIFAQKDKNPYAIFGYEPEYSEDMYSPEPELFYLYNNDSTAIVQTLAFDFENGIAYMLNAQNEVIDTVGIDKKAIFISTDPHYYNYPNTSPYAYCGNNPIMRTDPTGMDWVQDESGVVFWDKNVQGQSSFAKQYEGRRGFSYVSDADNTNSYSMPNGSGKLIMHEWTEYNIEDGQGGPSIKMEFVPSNKTAKGGWVQTFTSNIPDFSDLNYTTALPNAVASERLDGAGIANKSDITQSVFFDKSPSMVLQDMPLRILQNGAQYSVTWNAQSSMVINGVPAVSVGWGFSINSQNTGTYYAPTILNNTTPFHQNAIINALK